MGRLAVAALLVLAAACQKEKPAAAPAPVAAPAPPPPAAAPALAASGRVQLAVTDQGFVPAKIAAKAGVPITLVVTRKTDQTCAREILFQGQEGKTDLPLDKPVEVTFTPKAAGPVKFGCAMGMMIGGVLDVSN